MDIGIAIKKKFFKHTRLENENVSCSDVSGDYFDILLL